MQKYEESTMVFSLSLHVIFLFITLILSIIGVWALWGIWAGAGLSLIISGIFYGTTHLYIDKVEKRESKK